MEIYTLESLPSRLQNTQDHLTNTRRQLEEAKAAVDKPFPYEDLLWLMNHAPLPEYEDRYKAAFAFLLNAPVAVAASADRSWPQTPFSSRCSMFSG